MHHFCYIIKIPYWLLKYAYSSCMPYRILSNYHLCTFFRVTILELRIVLCLHSKWDYILWVGNFWWPRFSLKSFLKKTFRIHLDIQELQRWYREFLYTLQVLSLSPPVNSYMTIVNLSRLTNQYCYSKMN